MPLTEDVRVRRKPSVRAEATEERRQQILRAAVEAFAESGYNGTSLRDIAGRAGLSHTGLLHHFPDKPGLLEAVLDARVESASVAFPLGSEHPETFLRALVQVAEYDLTHTVEVRMFAIISAEALTPGHPAHGYLIRWHERVRSRLSLAFTELEARGRYRGRPLTPEQAALHVSALRDGVTLQWLLAPSQVDLVEAVRSQLQLCVDVDL
ncbi:TetR/AcrR family transcriptional regulator [uncultured Friedmanniella sp.]|uniref:TetR/AcrR family transcriptional regulator n=1 Tax=uncultured Friedmanniella sp. TaxID=335381 RepID=UPI0035CB8567